MRFKAHSLLASLHYAFSGIYFCLRTQRNMRIHVVAGFSAMGLGAWLALPLMHLAIVSIVASLVVTMEMMNTAIENAVDLATHRRHPLAKVAKDVAAAAVLVSAINALLVGLLLLGPPLWVRCQGWGAPLPDLPPSLRPTYGAEPVVRTPVF